MANTETKIKVDTNSPEYFEKYRALEIIMREISELKALKAMSILRQRFPQLIKLKKLVPLKIGIDQDFWNYGKEKGIVKLSFHTIRRGLKYYTRQEEYADCCTIGASRLDLNSKATGTISEEDRLHLENQSRKAGAIISMEKIHKRIKSNYDIAILNTKKARLANELNEELRAEKNIINKAKKKKKGLRKAK